MPSSPVEAVPVIAHAIQLAVAPVFLLTGVASLLGVMANRLARIIDRGRYYEQSWYDLSSEEREAAQSELDALERRRHMASWAINFCTLAALLVCLVVTTLFLDAFFDTDLKWMAGVLFTCAMLALIAGLASFLREVTLAAKTVRVLAGRVRSSGVGGGE